MVLNKLFQEELKLVSKKEEPPIETVFNGSNETFRFSSGEIWTDEKFFHGVYTARVKLPKGKGFWPAFWLYSGNPWNEIDIFEFWNENDFWGYYDPSKLQRIHHMNFWNEIDGNVQNRPHANEDESIDYSDNFHTFSMIWQEDYIQWFVDGDSKRLRSLHNPNPLNNDEPAFPVNPMHIVLNVAIQNSLDISSVIPNAWHFERPDYDAGYFPQQMEVLWVKHHYLAPFYDSFTVTDQDQVYLSSREDSYLTGNNLTFDCDF
jgi:beta-glucanase (GH16 family)